MRSLQQLVQFALLVVFVDANVLEGRAATPVFKSATEVGYIASYPTLNRDSMVATRVGNRMFWNSRDATNFTGQPFIFYSSTASWTDLNADGSPKLTSAGNLTTYGGNWGQAGSSQYFPLSLAQQNDRSPGRWVNWPDTPPLPVNGSNGAVKLYTWIKNVHVNGNGLVDNGNPPTVLYRADYSGSVDNNLPPVTIVNYQFWPQNAIPFGNYGWVMGTDGFAYLYGTAQNGTVLARVDPNKIEDKTAYSYYTPGAVYPFANATVPSFYDASRVIPNAGSGQQGTFYYSSYFQLYIWIGGVLTKGSEFYYTTAPNPWGPWATLQHLYTPTPGSIPAGYGYTWQALPGMSQNQGNGKDIWLAFCRVNYYYENVLLHLFWQ